MKEYQKGIYDLMMLLRKHGVILSGVKGLGEAYSDFLTINGIKRRKPTKLQLETLRKLESQGC